MPTLRITCPKCDLAPLPTDLWQCSCGHLWHTFDTYGRCQACNKVWKETQCLGPEDGGCNRWSPHLDWYRGLDEFLRQQLEEVFAREGEMV